MSDLANNRRRWFGSLFLILALGLLIWGQTVLAGRLHGIAYLAYWLFCFLFTSIALFIALLDAASIRRRSREQQKKLVHETIADLQNDSTDKEDLDIPKQNRS